MRTQFQTSSLRLFLILCGGLVIIAGRLVMLAFDAKLETKTFEQTNRVMRVKEAIAKGVIVCKRNEVAINWSLIEQLFPEEASAYRKDIEAASQAGALSCSAKPMVIVPPDVDVTELPLPSLKQELKKGNIYLEREAIKQKEISDPALRNAVAKAVTAGVLVRGVEFEESTFTESNPRLRQDRGLLYRGNIFDRNGKLLAETSGEGASRVRRRYPLSEKTFHILGYVGHPADPSASEGLEAVLAPIFRQDDTRYEALFKLDKGLFTRLLSLFKGEIVIPDLKKPPNFTLTIDQDLTELAWKLFEPYNHGALVCLEIPTGEVLAVVSKPSMNPESDMATWRKALDDRAREQRFLRRVWKQRYFPGSSFKIITSMIALDEQVIPNQALDFSINLTGEFRPCDYGKAIKGRKPGKLRLDEALAISDNEFFARLAVEHLACPRLFTALGSRGFYEGFSLLPEELRQLDSKGYFTVVPNQLTSKGEQICPAKGFDDCMLARSGIGQQDVQVTPLWMAFVVSAIANGGSAPLPYLVKRAVEYDEAAQPTNMKEYRRTENRTLMAPQTAAALRDMMSLVTKSFTRRTANNQTYSVYGTASRAFNGVTYQVAGKTGTAETGHKTNHTWFVCFGPLPQPRYAMAIVVENLPENSAGGRISAPIARGLFDYLVTNSTTEPAIDFQTQGPDLPTGAD